MSRQMSVLEQLPVRHAVILGAGFGTGMFPATLTNEKNMVTMGHFTIADYVVREFVDAGCEDVDVQNIIYVVSPWSTQVREHFTGRNKAFVSDQENKLKSEDDRIRAKAADLLKRREALRGKLNYKFPVQDMTGKQGTAPATLAAMDSIPDDAQFLLTMGDNISFREDGGNDFTDLVRATHAAGYKNGLLAAPVGDDDVHKYGMVEHDESGLLTCIKEKPRLSETSSRLKNLGMALINKADLVEDLNEYMETERTKEYYLTDVLTRMALSVPVLVVPAKGEHYDAGNFDDWLKWAKDIAPLQTKDDIYGKRKQPDA